MRKILLLAIILLNFLVLPSSVAVEKNVVIDRLTQSEAEDLDIEIPDEDAEGITTVQDAINYVNKQK